MPTIGNLGTLYVRNKDGVLEEVPVICGKDGEPGTPPHIGENGNWWIGETDTGTSAVGNGIDSIRAFTDFNMTQQTLLIITTSGERYRTTWGIQPNAIKRDGGKPPSDYDGSGAFHEPFWLDIESGVLYNYVSAYDDPTWTPVFGHRFITAGEGEPTAQPTPEDDIRVNDLYIDTTTGYIYHYTGDLWEQVGGKPGTGGGGGGTSFEVGEGLKLEDGILSLDAHEITNEELQEIIKQANGG